MDAQDFEWTCACCGETRRGLPEFAVPHPKDWMTLEESAIKTSTDDFFVFEDQTGRHYWIRAVIEVPIQGHDAGVKLGYGVWVSLSAKNAKRYRQSFDDDDQSKLGGMFGWLASGVPGSPGSPNLPATVWPQNHKRRPLVEVLISEGEQPSALWREQKDGVSPERIEALLTMLGSCAAASEQG